VVSHGGVTVDLLRNLLGDDGLPLRLVEDHIPPCAITTFDDLHVSSALPPLAISLTVTTGYGGSLHASRAWPLAWASPSGPLGSH
jgi:hypothetical protein